MSTKSRLDKLYKTCRRISLPEDCKILWVSDLHMNDGCQADDFKKNSVIFLATVKAYLEKGYQIFGLGDLFDLWEAKSLDAITNAYPDQLKLLSAMHIIKGNHDNSLDYPEAIVLQIGDDLEIFCAHGHQGDLFNDRLWWIGQHFVRYLWVPLQWIGLHDAQRAKRKRHESQEKRLCKWANEQKYPSIWGHTHLVADIGKYKNAGSWVQMGGEGIAYEDGKFSDKHFYLPTLETTITYDPSPGPSNSI